MMQRFRERLEDARNISTILLVIMAVIGSIVGYNQLKLNQWLNEVNQHTNLVQWLGRIEPMPTIILKRDYASICGRVKKSGADTLSIEQMSPEQAADFRQIGEAGRLLNVYSALGYLYETTGDAEMKRNLVSGWRGPTAEVCVKLRPVMEFYVSRFAKRITVQEGYGAVFELGGLSAH